MRFGVRALSDRTGFSWKERNDIIRVIFDFYLLEGIINGKRLV